MAVLIILLINENLGWGDREQVMGEGSCLEIWGLGSHPELRRVHGPSPLGMRSWDSPAGVGLCCLPPHSLCRAGLGVTQERHTGTHKGNRPSSHFFRPKIPAAVEDHRGNVQGGHPALPIFPVKHLKLHA